MPGLCARVQGDEHSGGLAPTLDREGGGKLQLLRRGPFRLRREAKGTTTHGPTPESDPETRAFRALGSVPQGHWPTYSQLRVPNVSRKPRLKQHVQICALRPVLISQHPNSLWSPQMPAIHTLPGPPRAARLRSPLPGGGTIQLRLAPGRPGAHRAAAGGGGTS